MKFLKNLTLKKRLLLLVALLIFPLLVIVANTVFSGLREIDKINNELEGLKHLKVHTRLVLLIQRHRGLTFLYLNGGKEVEGRIRKLESEIDSILSNCIEHCKDERVKEKLKRFKEVFGKLKIEDDLYSPEKSFERHTKLISEFLSLLKSEAFKHGILTEPDLIVRTLADTALLEIPKLIETAGRIRGLGSGILARGNITEEERRKIIELYGSLFGYERVVFWTIENIDVPEEILRSLKRAKNRVKEFLEIVENHFLIESKTKLLSPVDYFNTSTVTVDEIFRVYDLTSSYLNKVLEDKKSLFISNLLFKSSALFLLSGFILYIVFLIYRVTVSSLDSILFVAKRISEGDLDVKLRVETKDEIAVVASTLNTAIEKLKETITLLRDYKIAIDTSNIIFKTDPDGIIIYANKKFEELSGFSADEIIGKPITFLYETFTNKETLKEMLSSMKVGKLWKGRLVGRRKNGEKCIIDTTVVPVFKKDKSILEFLIVCHDITELEENRQKLQYLLNYDAVTGLPNRIKLLEDIQKLHRPAICVMDISDFRYLNELYGEECGDSILKQVAEELKKLESRVRLYRVYSDEFALLYDLEEGKINLKEFSDYCSETISSLEDKAFKCNDFDIFLNFTAGIAEGEEEKEKLLIHADMALNEAKRERKKIVFLKGEDRKKENYLENMLWIRKVKKAIEEDKIVPFYQPIVNNKTGKVEKFEALARLIDEDGSIVPPGKFLSIAKKSKLYPKITRNIVKKVFNDFERLPFEVSINLSFEDLISEKTVQFILNKVKKFADPSKITFEILETEEIENYNLLYGFISKIKELGCKFAIDDFGTGYSNLEHLMKLKVDYLKIDGSIIKRISEDKGARILTEAVVSFSKELKIKTIAEFVSDQNIYEMVKMLGVD
ncbi:EAL domain-containing protein [Desulfurobacterium crinifex]